MKKCPRGHWLRAPNLVACHLRRGDRSCLACNRAQAQLRKTTTWPDYAYRFETLADRKYAEIMEA